MTPAPNPAATQSSVNSADSPLTPDEFNAAVTSITSAFGDPTRRDIYLRVRDSEGGMTASEVAAAVDLHANVARHHLEKLVSAGHLRVEMGKPASGAGRPSKRYIAATTEIHLAFPVRRDDLLGTLLGRALTRLPHHEAEGLAEEVGVEYGLALAESIEPGDAHRSLQAAVATVADALTSHGFMARRGGSRSAAHRLRTLSLRTGRRRASRTVCHRPRLGQGMLAGLHGERTPQIERSVPMGDTVCTTTV